MATKLGRMMTYFERLLTIKSFYALITWSCKVTWQKNPLYLYCKSAYGKETWQNDDFAWWAPNYNVTWPFDHVAFWDTMFTYRTRFNTQTLKSWPTSCSVFKKTVAYSLVKVIPKDLVSIFFRQSFWIFKLQSMFSQTNTVYPKFNVSKS